MLQFLNHYRIPQGVNELNLISLLDTKLELIVEIFPFWFKLTHWGQMTHICFGKLNIIGSDNGLSPGQRHAIMQTSAGILLTLNVRGPSYLG